MYAFEQLAEQRIDEAIANGLFDDLVGKGKPLDLDDYFATPPHLRSAYAMLKSNSAVPPEVELMQEISRLEQELQSEQDDRAMVRLERTITHKKTELAMAMDRLRQATRNQRY